MNKSKVFTCEATITILPNGEKYIHLTDPSNDCEMMWSYDGVKWVQAKATDIWNWQRYIDNKKDK